MKRKRHRGRRRPINVRGKQVVVKGAVVTYDPVKDRQVVRGPEDVEVRSPRRTDKHRLMPEP